jgi:MoaA/NifB/PqqE/SkfB family radical SAM enzyme
MPNFNVLYSQRKIFQVAWESTLKCNLDCSYCGDGHDNTQPHPSLEESIKTVDFIVEYVNLYMSYKNKESKFANLNIQGGESIFHPNILEILEYARHKKNTYPDWNLDISLITNAIIGLRQWKKIVDLVDHFTISYHSESLPKQQEMFKENICYLKKLNKQFHVAVLMHPTHWDDCISMIEFCKTQDISVLPRQLDHPWSDFRFNYNDEQTEFLTGMKKVPVVTKVISFFKNGIDLLSQGRACCGGESMCTEKENNVSYVNGNNFKGWHCSVNKFFLYIRQTTGEIYTNKDCKMNLDGKVGVLGYLNNSKILLDDLKNKLETDTLPDIICKKYSCWCGLCAPKASTAELYNTVMERYSNANTSH